MQFFSNRVSHFLVLLSFLGLLFFASCKKDKPLSKLAGFTEFSIKDKATVAFTIDETARVIQNADSLPYQTNVSALVAVFGIVPNSTVKVGSVLQESGVTVNNFTSPLTYNVIAQDGVTTRTYTVRVNVALVDPNTVAWNQVTANAGWGTYYSTTAAFYNNKFWFSGRTINGDWGVRSSADGVTWAPLASVASSGGDTIPGVESSMVTFDNKLWLLGGHIGGFGSVSNKVWSSTDGLNWTVSVNPAGSKRWGGRQRIPAVVYNNKLWVVGGSGYPSFGNMGYSGAAFKDVWSSSNGTTWDSVNATPAFIARSSPALLVHKSKLWLIGGKTGALGLTAATDVLNDIWTSTDGNTWTQVTSTTPFTARWGHQVVSYNNELFLIGGEDLTGGLNDMWVSSDDGVTWTKVTGTNPRALPANFTGRAFFTAFVQNNTVWMLGGRSKESGAYTFRNDIWKGKLVK